MGVPTNSLRQTSMKKKKSHRRNCFRWARRSPFYVSSFVRGGMMVKPYYRPHSEGGEAGAALSPLPWSQMWVAFKALFLVGPRDDDEPYACMR